MSTQPTLTLYQNTNFNGETLVLHASDPNLGISRFNDKTSSITVTGPGSWMLYQNYNYGGDHWGPVSATGGVDGTGAYPNSSSWDGKNDSISSVQYIPPSGT